MKNQTEAQTTIVNFENVDHSGAIVDYIQQKFTKNRFFLNNIKLGEVKIKKDHTFGVNKYLVSISVFVKNRPMHFKEMGDNIFVIIDKINSRVKQNISKLKSSRNFQSKTSMKFLF